MTDEENIKSAGRRLASNLVLAHLLAEAHQNDPGILHLLLQGLVSQVNSSLTGDRGSSSPEDRVIGATNREIAAHAIESLNIVFQMADGFSRDAQSGD